MRTEDEILSDIKKLYSERTKVRVSTYKKYVGKCYFMNEMYYCIERILDRAIGVLVISDEGTITRLELNITPDTWNDYEITKEVFIEKLQDTVNLIIKQVNGE